MGIGEVFALFVLLYMASMRTYEVCWYIRRWWVHKQDAKQAITRMRGVYADKTPKYYGN